MQSDYPESGIFENVPFEKYQRHPGINKSGLDRIARSPAHFLEYLQNPPEPSAAMTFGSAFHCALLEPHNFEKQYTCNPEKLDRRTREGKAAWNIFQESNMQRRCLELHEMEAIRGMSEAVYKNKIARNLLAKGSSEVTLYWKIILPGFGPQLCKGRPDHLRDDGIIVDIKTTENAAPFEFTRSLANFRYHVQAAMYLDAATMLTGRRYDRFIFIVIEKRAPYGIGIYVIDEMSLARGRELYARDLALYARCKATDNWPCYSDEGILDIRLPNWAANDF